MDRHERGIVPLVIRVHEVDAGEKFVRGEHAAVRQAGDLLELRQTCAGADEHSLVAADIGIVREQLVDGQALADRRVAHDVDAERGELVDLLLHERLRQTELRNAVSQHAAGLMEVLIHGDLIAELGQIARAGKTGRAGADDCDSVAVGGHLFGHLVRVLHRPVGDEALQTADADRLALDAAHALAFALLLLRADTAADGGQGAVFENLLIRALEVLLADQGDEIGDLDVDRAARHARGVLAVQTAGGLVERELHGVAEGDLVKVFIADSRFLFGNRVLFRRHIRHDYCSSFRFASSASAIACRLQ